MSFLVVFDLDNTLVHSQIDFSGMRAAVISLLRKRNLSGESDDQLRRLSVGEIISLGADKNDGFEREAWQSVVEFERAGMLQATVEDDAATTLGVLQAANFKLAILTNNAREATIEALENFSLDSYFDLILTRNEVAMKPESDGLLKAKSDLKAERTVMIGDSWLDGAAANSAKIPFIAFRPAENAFANHKVEVWKTAQQLCEVPELLKISADENRF